MGAGPKKLYPYSEACIAARHVEKFREVIPIGPKVITANMLNFKPIFEFSLLKIVGGPKSPMRCWLASLCHSLARVKIRGTTSPIGAEIWPSKKLILGGQTLAA